MLEGQFYTRLILNIIVGIMFAYALVKMAQHNNQEVKPQKHIVMKIFGWIFVGLSGILLISCVVSLVNLDFPPSVIGPFISSNMIVRPTSATFYWGYPTIIQNSILLTASGVFAFLGLGGYFLFFKSSKSKWWEKILKFFTVLFLYAFMASSTNFHYFDFWEFVAPILFLTLWFIIINRGSDVKDQTTFIKDSFGENHEEQNNNYPNDDFRDNNIHINESDIIEVSKKNISQFEEHSIGQNPEVSTSKSTNPHSDKISIKPYFWIGLILIILGNVWCLCFNYDSYDYYRYHIYTYINPWNDKEVIYQEFEFQVINIVAWIFILSILSIFLIKKEKSIGWFTSCINKQSKVIAILNICYLMGWLIFSIILVLSINEFIEQEIWAGFILVWLIICTILNYTIKMSVEPKSEFYLIPKWLKKILVRRNLNTKLVYRIILLFIVWPFFYLCLVPVVGFIPCIYTACASGILGLILCCIPAFNWIKQVFNWIKQGKGVKVE